MHLALSPVPHRVHRVVANKAPLSVRCALPNKPPPRPCDEVTLHENVARARMKGMQLAIGAGTLSTLSLTCTSAAAEVPTLLALQVVAATAGSLISLASLMEGDFFAPLVGGVGIPLALSASFMTFSGHSLPGPTRACLGAAIFGWCVMTGGGALHHVVKGHGRRRR